MSHVSGNLHTCRTGVRRPLTILLAVALASPSLARATEPAPADFDSEIAALVKQQKYREAAFRLEEELRQLPETQENRLRRNELASQAVNAYREAFRAAPEDCALASSGLTIADEYMDRLLSAYGEGARDWDEFQGMSKLETALDDARAERNCPEREASPARAPAPEPAPASPKPPLDTGSKRRDRLLIAGIAVSASLAVANLAVTIGTSLPRRKPDGQVWQGIREAAMNSYYDGVPGNEVPFDKDSNMCSDTARANNGDVDDACDKWFTLQRVSIGSGAVAGVMGITTIALIAVLAKRQQNDSNVAALLRKHKATLGVSPVGRGGLNVNLGFAF